MRRSSIRLQNSGPTNTFTNTAYAVENKKNSKDASSQTDTTMQGSESEAQMAEVGRNNVNVDAATGKTQTKSSNKKLEIGGCSKDAKGFSSDSDFHNLPHILEATNDENNKKSTTTGLTRAYVRDAKAMVATPADVNEYPNSYVFIVDMPSLKSGDIKVQVEDDNVLVISGERKKEYKQEGVKYVRMERRIGKFMRKFALPENANTEKIYAICQDGVLTVTVKKPPPPEPKKPKLIQVQVA